MESGPKGSRQDDSEGSHIRKAFLQIDAHPFDVIHDLGVGVSDDLDAQRVQPARPGFIVSSARIMAVAVDLDRQHQFGAVEIDDVAVQRLLTGELQP